MQTNCRLKTTAVFLLGLFLSAACADENWQCEILAPEREITRDATSGAELVFVTRSPSRDVNLYFHQRSWLPDGSLLLFISDRFGSSEVMGYIEATGELVRLQRPGQTVVPRLTAGRFENSVYLVEGEQVYEWEVKIEAGSSGGKSASKVQVAERVIGTVPDEATQVIGFNENSDGTMVVFAYYTKDDDRDGIAWMDKTTGEVRRTALVEGGVHHLQCSWDRPGLVMFCKEGTPEWQDRCARWPSGELSQRMWLMDMSDEEPRMLYPQVEGELVTHECFWVDNRVTFCSGQRHAGISEEAHVKVIDIDTGIARIIGAGAWWSSGTPYEISKRNWWHCSGAPNGEWVAGDNWHGDIGIFSAKTARTRILTESHRVYGKGDHPHVGWGPFGDRVVFTSHRHGSSDVCVAVIPDTWSEDR